jgi:hypothetical protein
MNKERKYTNIVNTNNETIEIVLNKTYGYRWNEEVTFKGRLEKFDIRTKTGLIKNDNGILMVRLDRLYDI